MEIKQIYELLNDVTDEMLGKRDLFQEDLSNSVDAGKTLFDSVSVDNYVKSLVNHIGKVVFVNRPYSGNFPSIFRDAWEFGSILEKVTAQLPPATENESWELEDNQSYDPNIFYKPVVTAKFFNKAVTMEIPMSITDKQVKESFSSATQLNGFFSMLETAVSNSMTIKIDGFISRLVNNMIAETIDDDYSGTDLGTTSGKKAVNVLYLYNTKFNKTLKADDMTTDPDFIRYFSYILGVYRGRLSRPSVHFNVEETDKFTTNDRLRMIMLTDMKMGADVYLQSDVFHNEFTKLPIADEVPYWQGSGEDYDFEDISSINVKTSGNNEVEASGILACMFDKDAIAACNEERKVTSNYNSKAEFTNFWHKWKLSGYNDLAEQFVVFFGADAPEDGT